MAVRFKEDSNHLTLYTKESAYQMQIDDHGVLLHTWYGAKIDDRASHLIELRDRGFSSNPPDLVPDRTYSLDYLPQEIACLGNGDLRDFALDVAWANGTHALDLRVVDYSWEDKAPDWGVLPHFWSDKDHTLCITLKDREKDLYVHLYYTVYYEYDLITRSLSVENRTDETVVLHKAASASVDFPTQDWTLLHFAGRHNKERARQDYDVQQGRFKIYSSRGVSSHQHNPTVVLKRPDATEDFGPCYGFALVYSGGFDITCEGDQYGQTRLVMGLDSQNFSWPLEPGQSFQTPELAMTYSGQGMGKMSRDFHKAVREHLIRSPWQNRPRPIVVNNWEATYFDFTGEKLLEIVDVAREIGLDMFVLDDGWFGARDWDDRGLGDWQVNEKKLGMPLRDLVKEVNKRGLEFGLWVEPEMINKDSDLFRAHPDWALTVPGRQPLSSREQLILDITNPEARRHVMDEILKVMAKAENVRYVKWDMNRSVLDTYLAGADSESQGMYRHLYVLAMYEMTQTLLDAYPDLLLEGCSGGGGRFDLGMLYFVPQIWTSDNTDASDRVEIQYGTSFFYPPSAISAHVSAVPNHQNHRTTPLKSRGIVAYQGSFGYELDLTRLSEEEIAEMKDQVETYRALADLVLQGDYYRLTNPFSGEAYTAWSTVDPAGKKAILSVYFHDLKSNYPNPILRFKGLLADGLYELSLDGRVLGKFLGQTLMEVGFRSAYPEENYQAFLYQVTLCE
jgi:alpha-galactosidase